MIDSKPAQTQHPIHELIKNRWSPIAIDPNKKINQETVNSLLEAARWAPSSFNEQPWSYVIGYKGDQKYDQLSDCLAEGNSWAKSAPVLMLSIAKTFFDHKHKPNAHHMHDLGAASTLMHLQATALDLHFHQMAGFDSEKARQNFNINQDYTPAAMIAIGHPQESALTEDQTKRDQAPRERKPLEELIWQDY